MLFFKSKQQKMNKTDEKKEYGEYKKCLSKFIANY